MHRLAFIAILWLVPLAALLGGADKTPPGWRERKPEETPQPSAARKSVAVAPGQNENLHATAEYQAYQAAEKEENWKEMQDAARELVTKFPEDAEAHWCLGHANAGLQYFDNALVAFREAIKIKADYPEAWYGMGLCYSQQDKEEDALAAYRQAVKLKPGYVEALVNLGNIHARNNRLNDAIAVFSQATRLGSADSKAWCNLGICYSRQHKHNEAIPAYLRAIQLQPDNAIARGSLVLAYRSAGQAAKAAEALDELRRRDPQTARKIEGLVK